MSPMSNKMCAFATSALQIFKFNSKSLSISTQVSYMSSGGDNIQVIIHNNSPVWIKWPYWSFMSLIAFPFSVTFTKYSGSAGLLVKRDANDGTSTKLKKCWFWLMSLSLSSLTSDSSTVSPSKKVPLYVLNRNISFLDCS